MSFAGMCLLSFKGRKRLYNKRTTDEVITNKTALSNPQYNQWNSDEADFFCQRHISPRHERWSLGCSFFAPVVAQHDDLFLNPMNKQRAPFSFSVESRNWKWRFWIINRPFWRDFLPLWNALDSLGDDTIPLSHNVVGVGSVQTQTIKGSFKKFV